MRKKQIHEGRVPNIISIIVLSDPKLNIQLLRWVPVQSFQHQSRFGEASQAVELWVAAAKPNEHNGARPWGGALNSFLSVLMEINHCHLNEVPSEKLLQGDGRWR
jgi:hypothetical protein